MKDSWNNIKASTTETWNNIKEGVSSAWENIKSGTSTALSNLKTNVSEAWSSIKSNTSEAWNNMKDNALTPMTNGVQAVTDVSGNNAGNAKLDAMSDAIIRYLPRMAESKIVLDSGVLVGELSDGINRQLGKAYV